MQSKLTNVTPKRDLAKAGLKSYSVACGLCLGTRARGAKPRESLVRSLMGSPLAFAALRLVNCPCKDRLAVANHAVWNSTRIEFPRADMRLSLALRYFASRLFHHAACGPVYTIRFHLKTEKQNPFKNFLRPYVSFFIRFCQSKRIHFCFKTQKLFS